MSTDNLSSSFTAFSSKFDKESFSPLLSKVSRKEGWDDDYAQLVLDEYIKFFYLASLPTKVHLVPSHDVDEIWHQHILTTKKYQKDCERLVGKFVHHNPSFTLEEREKLPPLFDKMKAAYEVHFGRMPENVWQNKADECTHRCDDCGGCAD
ncbi:hypothetical protein TrVE_jg3241 [Triparma verrucosa]|uniref:Glycine-rich domain-containing protein-like n=1 Tax=Triparma verrucosa TaxID=1606542 RepID=A0A9W7EYS5_9STRA|nr:hypothetical protein TrVE_jg3241 [Triparma verrucosa]